MKKLFALLLLTTLNVVGQSVPANYQFPSPFPTNGSVTTTNTLRVTGTVTGTSYNNPMTWDAFVGGGLRSVSDTAEMNGINSRFRKQGMIVITADDMHMHALDSTLTNWIDMGLISTNSFSGGGGGTTIYTGDGSLDANRTIDGASHDLSILDVDNRQDTWTGDWELVGGPTSTFVLNTEGSFSLSGATNNYAVIGSYVNGLGLKSTTKPIRLLSPAVWNGTATVGQVWTLTNALSGAGEFATLSGLSNNLYNVSGTLTDDRTISMDGKFLFASGGSTFAVQATNITLTANTTLTHTAPTINLASTSLTSIDSGGILPFLFTTSPNDGQTNDYVLGISPVTGEIRWNTSVKIGDITGTNGGGSSPYQLYTVDTVADLVALDPAANMSAATLGYYAANDGGAGVYYWVNDTTSTNHGSKIASATAGSWVLTGSSTVNVLQWGAVRDGTTPTAARMNEAFEYSETIADGCRIWIPSGEYAIEETLYIRRGNVHIRQNGWLRNVNGTNDTTLVLSAAWNDHSLPLTNGIPTYESSKVTIDGEGLGVIDQNSQNATMFASDDPAYASFHTLVAYGIDELQIKNLTLTNGIIWSMAVELCNNFTISGNKVYTGFCNNRTVDGVPTYLGGQDGIHPHDSANGSVTDNYISAGDDAIAVTSSRAFAHDITVIGNRPSVKPIAYEANGTTQNTHSVQGRYALAAYCAAQTTYCGLTNVTFSGNIISGGSGLFGVYDDGVAHVGVPSSISYIGNTFTDIISPGATLPVPSLDQGWIVNGSAGVEFIGNTFKNIARWGRLGGGFSTLNTVVTFKDNLFTGFLLPYPTTLFPGQAPAILWSANNTVKLVLDGNTFLNNAIVPVGIGSVGDTTTNVFEQVIVTGNQFFNNNTQYSASTAPTNYAAAVFANGVNFLSFNNNTVMTNYGHAVLARAFKSFEATGNNIRGIGNSTFTSYGDVFRVLNQPDVSALETSIKNNLIRDVDGRFIDSQNTGTTTVVGNDIKNVGRSYNSNYAVTIVADGASLSAQPYLQWGGYFFGNNFSRSSAQSPLYLNSTISTTGYTGSKFRYNGTTNNFYNSVYTPAVITFNAEGFSE